MNDGTSNTGEPAVGLHARVMRPGRACEVFFDGLHRFAEAESWEGRRSAGKAIKEAYEALDSPAVLVLAAYPPGQLVPSKSALYGRFRLRRDSPKVLRGLQKWITKNYNRLRWYYLREANGGEVRCRMCRTPYRVIIGFEDDVTLQVEPGIGLTSKAGAGIDSAEREHLVPNDDVMFVCSECFERDNQRFHRGGNRLWSDAPITTPWDDALNHVVDGSYGSRQ